MVWQRDNRVTSSKRAVALSPGTPGVWWTQMEWMEIWKFDEHWQRFKPDLSSKSDTNVSFGSSISSHESTVMFSTSVIVLISLSSISFSILPLHLWLPDSCGWQCLITAGLQEVTSYGKKSKTMQTYLTVCSMSFILIELKLPKEVSFISSQYMSEDQKLILLVKSQPLPEGSPKRRTPFIKWPFSHDHNQQWLNPHNMRYILLFHLLIQLKVMKPDRREMVSARVWQHHLGKTHTELQ